MDVEVARLAERQHGRVSRRQLVALGLTLRMIRHRVRAGRLHVVHPGVYAVGHRHAGPHARWMAAVLACGDGAVLSHRSAAALWNLRPSARARVDVTTPTSRRAAPPSIDLHRTSTLRPCDVVTRDGIPVSSVARTLVDLAAVVRPEALERAVHEALVLRLLDVAAVEAAIGDGTGRRGVAALRRALALPDAGVRRSELEHRFVRLCRRAGLPSPRCNVHVPAGGALHEVDAWWPDRRLAVELDGAATHLTPRAFEADRRRDAALLRAGVTVLRVTWRRLADEPDAVADDLRALLARAS